MFTNLYKSHYSKSIYIKLEKVIGDLSSLPHSTELRLPGCNKLIMRVIDNDPDLITMSFTDYFKHEDIFVPDSRIGLYISPTLKMAEAFSFDNMVIRKEVYSTSASGQITVDYEVRLRLNKLIDSWFSAILALDEDELDVQKSYRR